MEWLTDEMKKFIDYNISRSQMRMTNAEQNEFNNRRSYPIVSHEHGYDRDLITRDDGSKEFIREPKFNYKENHMFDCYRYMVSPLLDLRIDTSLFTEDIKRICKIFNYPPELVCSCGASQYPDILNYVCERTTNDFSHLNINKMKMEALNKANELSNKIKDLQEHRRQMQHVFETDKKEPKFKLSVSSGCYHTTETRQEMIPAGFAKQYLANIDKAIKSIEKEIERL